MNHQRSTQDESLFIEGLFIEGFIEGTVCGTINLTTSHKAYECKICKKKGHLAKMCKQRVDSENKFLGSDSDSKESIKFLGLYWSKEKVFFLLMVGVV